MGEPEDKQAELIEHLAELRTRIIRSAGYVALGTAVCWFFYGHIFRFITAPVTSVLKNTKFLMTGLAEGFMLQLQVCVIAGLAVAAPLVTLELWGFVSPALTHDEKRPLKWIAPFSALLFAAGVALCYCIMPVAVRWFVSYTPPGAEFRPIITPNLIFVVKMLFAFGVAFELPIVLMFLGKLGVINSRMMKTYWRQAVVLVAIGAAVATPSSDALSMMMMAAPLCILYVLSIVLVKAVERKNDI